jgi:hypothetical protein
VFLATSRHPFNLEGTEKFKGHGVEGKRALCWTAKPEIVRPVFSFHHVGTLLFSIFVNFSRGFLAPTTRKINVAAAI